MVLRLVEVSEVRFKRSIRIQECFDAFDALTYNSFNNIVAFVQNAPCLQQHRGSQQNRPLLSIRSWDRSAKSALDTSSARAGTSVMVK